MPCFEYYCASCKIIFEELLTTTEDIKKYTQKCPCKQCKKSSPRVPISVTNFNFKAPPGQTMGSGVHGQSGVHDLDYPVVDKAVGRSASKKWQIYDERKKSRDKLRKEYGTNSVATVGNKVVPLSKDNLEVRDKALKLYQRAKQNTK